MQQRSLTFLPAFISCARMIDLARPLVFLDLETTGTDVEQDRIIEIALAALQPDGAVLPFNTLIDPGVPLPERISEITGITEEMLADAPHFSVIAPVLNEFLENADLAGYNLLRFDLPLLENEFLRCGMSMASPANRSVIDAFQIFRMREPHTLERAVGFYTGHPIQQSHRAFDDVVATAEVLAVQLARYDLYGTIDDVEKKARRPFLDREGKLKEVDGQVVFCFGKYNGQAVAEVFATDPDYIGWAIENIGGEIASILSEIVEYETAHRSK